MQIRSSDPLFMRFVMQWFDVLLPKLRNYLYENGGPVILVQVENEYGSYGCDFAYTTSLRDLIRSHLGNDVVLFTTDGFSNDALKCGKISGVYAAVDFGVEVNPKVAFYFQRLHESQGPLINNEFYPGWLDHWLYPHQTVDTSKVIDRLDTILSLNASVNL
jgi:beta-galactosidase